MKNFQKLYSFPIQRKRAHSSFKSISFIIFGKLFGTLGVISSFFRFVLFFSFKIRNIIDITLTMCFNP